MDPKALEKAFRSLPHPQAVVVVDLYGQSADYNKILKICREHDVPVLEDAAEALGSSYKGKSAALSAICQYYPLTEIKLSQHQAAVCSWATIRI